MARKKNLVTLYIFIGMGLGLLIGTIFPDIGAQLRPLSLIFIRMIKSIIAPPIFATIVVGIAGHNDLKAVGRMGVKALVYFEVVTSLALFIGLAFVNIVRPGVGVALKGGEVTGIASQPQKFGDVLIHFFPQSFFQAAAGCESSLSSQTIRRSIGSSIT
jgi:proton glutamate symport protein